MQSIRNPLAILTLCFVLAGCGDGGGGDSVAGSTDTKRADAPDTHAPGSIGGCIEPGKNVKAETFPSPNGDLKGALIGSGSTGIVFANQSGNDLCQWQDYVRGLPPDEVTSALFAYDEVASEEEVRAVAEALRKAGAKRVIAVGASLGGRAVVELAADPESGVDAVVSLSGERMASSDGPADLLPFANRATIPVLYVSASGDGLTTFAKDTRQLYAAGKEVDGTDLIVTDGKKHGTALLQLPEIRAAVQKVIDG
ncbi:hypothetical protein BH10ACT11_BH10ACT11_18940 [soil metagenome]